MFERFTEAARKAVVLAQDEARRLRHGHVDTQHLLLGLLREKEGIAAQTLDHLGLTVPGTRQRVEDVVGQGEEEPRMQAPFAPRAKKVLELSLREALQLGHNYIGTEHLLLGLVRESEGVAARIFSDLEVDPEKVRREVVRRQGDPRRGSSRGSGKRRPTRRAYLGLESGVGDRPANLRVAIEALESGPQLEVLGKSVIYESETTGDDEQQAISSCVLEVESGMPAAELLRYCQGVEVALGRAVEEEERAANKRVKVYLLLYGMEVAGELHLTVPHPKALLARNLRAIANMGRNPRIPEVSVKDLLASVEALGSVKETSTKGWIGRGELEERYGEEFVRELDAEAKRLLSTENSSLREMADERFSADELAEASALLRILFRHRKEGTSGGQT